MNVNIKGGRKFQKKLIGDVALWSAGFLMSSRLWPKLTVNVRLCKPDGLFGSCVWSDSNVRPRAFDIEIHKELDEYTMIETMCHEMVHLKQFARGQMKEHYRPVHRVTWYGEDLTEVEYDDQPWELEASLLETFMAHQYLKYKYKLV